MKFKDIYYDESTVYHYSDRPSKEGREVLRPKIVPIPEDLPKEANRLVSVYNDPKTGIFTFVFKDKEPLGMIMGTLENPAQSERGEGFQANPKAVDMFWKVKEFTPFNGSPLSYGGEVRIEPPFKGYVEHPLDKGTKYFNDFSANTEYDAQKNIEDSPKKRI